jgi:hypothetical protein
MKIRDELGETRKILEGEVDGRNLDKDLTLLEHETSQGAQHPSDDRQLFTLTTVR